MVVRPPSELSEKLVGTPPVGVEGQGSFDPSSGWVEGSNLDQNPCIFEEENVHQLDFGEENLELWDARCLQKIWVRMIQNEDLEAIVVEDSPPVSEEEGHQPHGILTLAPHHNFDEEIRGLGLGSGGGVQEVRVRYMKIFGLDASGSGSSKSSFGATKSSSTFCKGAGRAHHHFEGSGYFSETFYTEA